MKRMHGLGRRRIALYQQELIKTHFTEVENMYRQMRGWRHDYRNHIQTLKAYVAKGDLESISAYLDRLDTDLQTVDTVIKTGNRMTDAILNSKISLAKSRKISVIRSRNISMSCVFQNLAGLQNRYPNNQWQEILGNCDITLFLGCTDALTAQFISDRTGEASISVTSRAKQLGTWRISNYTPEYRETSGVGKRKLMTMDEVLRMDIDKALVILRGKKVLEVDKYDYSKHPEAKKLRAAKAASHIPAWQAQTRETEKTTEDTASVPPPVPMAEPITGTTPPPVKRPAARPAPKRTQQVVSASKESILLKPKKEE